MAEFARKFGPMILHEMEVVELSGMKGGQNKKDVVLHSLKSLVEAAQINEDSKVHLRFLLAYVVPNLIDLIVAASKGGVAINMAKFCCF